MSLDDTVEPAALVRYLSDLAQLRTKSILDVDHYDNVLWLSDLPTHPKCRSALDDAPLADEAAWIVVDRVELPPRPELSEQLRPWLEAIQLDRPELEPYPHDSISLIEEVETGDGRDLVSVEHRLNDHEEIVRLWAEYVEVWRGWSAQRRLLDPVHRAYNDLFRSAEHIRQVGEQVEVVLAVGLLLVAGERGRVRRHLLTAPAQIVLNPQSGRISVEPAADVDAVLALEQDMLTPNETPSAAVQELIRNDLSQLSDPLDLAAVTRVLEMWANGASADGRFEAGLAPTSGMTDAPVVRLAPALIVRPRSQAALLDTYREILLEIADGGTVPATFGDLATTSGGELTDEERSANGLDLAGEQWFPLPANQEQAQIVEALRSRRGVIVHGPPGTGKSHTIANLISHAMAMGQRVLVTAHSARALEVLADKLPTDIRSLTVTMLGQGRRGTDDLERSANEILRRRQDPDWKRDAINDRLVTLLDRLEGRRAQRSATLKWLGELREQETASIDLGFGGFAGTRAEIASQLAAAAPAPEWLATEPDGDPPLTQQEVDELIGLVRRLSPADLELGRLLLPSPSVVLPVDVASAAIDRFHRCGELVDSFADVSGESTDAVGKLSPQVVHALAEKLCAYENAQLAIGRRGDGWIAAASADLARGNEAVWRSILQHSSAFVSRSQRVADFDRVQVEMPHGVSRLTLRAQAETLGEYFDGGGIIRRLAVANSKVVKDCELLLTMVRVEGEIPADSATCQRFVDWCDAHATIELAESYWPAGILAPSTSLMARCAAIVDAHAALSEVFASHAVQADLAALIRAERVDTSVVPSSSDRLRRVSEAVAARASFETAKSALVPHYEALRSFADQPGANPVCHLLASAIERCDSGAYGQLWSALEGQRQLVQEVQRHDIQLAKLDSVLPAAAAVVSDPAAAPILQSWSSDWDLARARAWLGRLERADANGAARLVSDTDDQIRALISEVGANKAWLAAIGRLTDAETQHLKAYQAAMKRVGKGGSKFDFKYRQEARAHLAQCQSAIPAWIMPAHQVAATMPHVAGLFDLVIIDEASQSGVEELFLFWLGKQVVVVGDKQQISPEASFVKGEAQDLQRRHLDDWSFAGLLGPENSLFDVAEVKYVSGEVWLSEHFRSMPEIIEYSNKLCYADHRLEPVRQFGEDRLPPLRRKLVPYVPNGSTQSARVNRDEADAIVAQVVECLHDPAYVHADGRPLTMGVISLLGADQAKLIQQRLLAEVDTKTWGDRKLHVGDASDFQGDERDVIFLSMVKTPQINGTRVPKLGHDRDARRFNVAASRARDQLWLFHSLELSDLNPDCPRARLIAHMDNPGLEGLEGYDGVLDRDQLTPPFESLFEQRVFLDLAHRGYVIKPQWKVLGYRIDLVVIGAESRLAIEVDGDFWHGPDKYSSDLARQGDLERVGWRIVRIKEWEYYSDRDRALSAVLLALDDLNIGPGASRLRDPAVPSRPDTEFEFEMDLPTDASPADATPSAVDSAPVVDHLNVALGTEEATGAHATDSLTGRAADLTASVKPYEALTDVPSTDPTSATPRQLAEAIATVVAAEGPIVADRVFHLINSAAGYKRMGRLIRLAFQAALDLKLRDGSILSDNPLEQDALFATLRTADQPSVRLRTIGPRSFQQIPPSEIAEMLAALSLESGFEGPELYRQAHLQYGIARLREASLQHYDACATLNQAD